MPAWLREPAPSSGGWKRSALLWTGSLAALALVFAGSMWLFEEHKADSAMGVVALSSGAAASAAPATSAAPASPVVAEPPKARNLPPLVLLEPAPVKVANVQDQSDIIQPLEPVTPAPAVTSDAPNAAAGVTKLAPKTAPPANAPAPAAKDAVRAESVIVNIAPAEPAPAVESAAIKAPPVKPLAAPAGPKPASGTLAAKTPVQRKSPVARNPATKGSAKGGATPKKPPANRNGTLLAKARPSAVAGVTLRPAREMRDDDAREPEQPRSRPPLPGRCQPGELARECSARLGLR